ncbi:MAG: type I-C CRISPR-associated protein Cas8c/Csd1, partial [Butyrivibrio hungatei]|nr:type I-C CRISPR-associated protein Cas8c/Csd1 [Butyrivibrio hungatei]
MIIQELATYYDSLVQLEKVGAIGWSKAKVSYGLQIDNSGQLVGIITLLQKPNGVKKEIPQEMIVPEQVKRSSGVSANFLCDNSTYFLGFDDKGRNDLEKKKNKERAKKCFEAAKALHHKVLDGVVDEEAEALLKFFDQWNPEQISDCEILKDYADTLFKGANLIFSSQSSKYLHENILIKKAWDNYRNHESVLTETGLCLVSGERKPIARLHPNIKGIFGAQSSGASLVSYNTSSLDSYNKEQGMNAPVSEDVAFKYGAALNYLISDKEYNKRISDTTIVYWAENAEVGYQDIWGDSFFGDGNITQDRLNSIAEDMRLGKAVSYKDVELYGNTKFCVLGIVPNAARLSVSFYSEGRF